ncbi:SH3 domain-containing protein [Sulfurovum sp. bin170]|uniref:SH3 domain-containing protein n=1 Tax=Sulfurovum sp. bin170 TaxID=2695268 RepID=UPI0013E00DDE|nr:SH3 domain-containing protein [Sulfurovum sp. bin170]NEW60295.1 SH3 domain-containing protein [Sulfurovum sp. bin170]
MKKIILLLILTMGLLDATEYRLIHLKKGAKLNVREIPVVNSRTAVGTLPSNAIGITIRECKYNKQGREWCYISYPIGGKHIEGWISRYYLEPMDEWFASKLYIKNFLRNYYMADEENFLDKLNVFYHFPMQQYMWKKSVSHMQLRSKKVSFYKKWPKRSYNMTYMKILKRKDTYIDVQTTVRWKFKNYKDDESGKDIQKIRLVHDGEQFQVLAIKNLKHTVFPKKIEHNTTTVDTNQTITADADKKFYIKIGSFFRQPNDEYFLNIGRNGFTYVQLEDKDQDGNMVKRIYIGPYETTEQAMALLEKVRSSINKNAYIQSF